jgi:hypothetical protein
MLGETIRQAVTPGALAEVVRVCASFGRLASVSPRDVLPSGCRRPSSSHFQRQLPRRFISAVRTGFHSRISLWSTVRATCTPGTLPGSRKSDPPTSRASTSSKGQENPSCVRRPDAPSSSSSRPNSTDREGDPSSMCSSPFQEQEISGGENEDDSNIHHQPCPGPVSEEQQIDADDDDYQQYGIKDVRPRPVAARS